MSEAQRREYYTEKRRESRARENRQKAANTKETEKNRRKLSRSLERTKSSTPLREDAQSLNSPKSSTISKATVFRKRNKIKEILPQSPRSFAVVMDKVIGDATPKKQNELQKRGINRKLEDEYNEDIVQSINTTVHEFRSEMTEDKRQHYNLLLQACLRTSKYKSAHRIASTLGFGDKMREKMKRMKNQKMNITRRQRKDTIDPLTVAKVEDHWRSEGISRIVPLKKKVKARKPLYVLETSYTAAYKKFKVSNPDLKIGYVSFIKHKPQNVRHLKAMERLAFEGHGTQCLLLSEMCEYSAETEDTEQDC